MGKKKKKTDVYTTVVTDNELVKLTYIQTLAISQNIANTSALETAAGKADLGGYPKEYKPSNTLDAIIDWSGIFGFGKKVKVSNKTETGGKQIKEQWLQPEFDIIRYSIGVKELTASAYSFSEKSELVSVPFFSPKEIIKVYLLVDQYIPPQFDQNSTWITYYIKPEGINEWIRINPSNSSTKFDIEGNIIPKIINFNIPKPTTAQLEDKYKETENPVKQLRFKAILSRPGGANNESMTPLLKSYRLVMVPRE
jgi:hypothetical protein